MTLRHTELIGRNLVKHGFKRSSKTHFIFSKEILYKGSITVEFKKINNWCVIIQHRINNVTNVSIGPYFEVITTEWLEEEYHRLYALFKFAKI